MRIHKWSDIRHRMSPERIAAVEARVDLEIIKITQRTIHKSFLFKFLQVSGTFAFAGLYWIYMKETPLAFVWLCIGIYSLLLSFKVEDVYDSF